MVVASCHVLRVCGCLILERLLQHLEMLLLGMDAGAVDIVQERAQILGLGVARTRFPIQEMRELIHIFTF